MKSRMLTCKPVAVSDVFSGGLYLGRFEETSEWRGFVEMKCVQTGDTIIMMKNQDSFPEMLFPFLSKKGEPVERQII